MNSRDFLLHKEQTAKVCDTFALLSTGCHAFVAMEMEP